MTLPDDPWLLFDILLQIVHYLDPNHDISTLRSLSTPCHTLCAPCQRHLFSSITIRELSDEQNEGLHNLLLKSPHLGSCIRYLDYSYINCHGEPFLAGLLNQLPVANIEVLKLSSENRHLYGCYGRDSPRALVRMFRSPRMRQLQLQGLSNIPWFTTDTPNLEKLVLDVHGVEQQKKDAQHVTLGLKSLTVGWRSGWVSYHEKLVLRGSPLRRNLRCYCKYPIRASLSVN